MKYLFISIAIILSTSVKIFAQVPAETIPDFTFCRLDKSSFTTKDIEKGKLLFFVFFDSECEHCRHAISYINKHVSGLNKTALYLLSLDEPEKIKSFINTYGKSLVNKKDIFFLQDINNEFISKFKPKKYPSMFLYAANKKLLMYDDDEQKLPQFFKEINAYQK